MTNDRIARRSRTVDLLSFAAAALASCGLVLVIGSLGTAAVADDNDEQTLIAHASETPPPTDPAGDRVPSSLVADSMTTVRLAKILPPEFTKAELVDAVPWTDVGSEKLRGVALLVELETPTSLESGTPAFAGRGEEQHDAPLAFESRQSRSEASRRFWVHVNSTSGEIENVIPAPSVVVETGANR